MCAVASCAVFDVDDDDDIVVHGVAARSNRQKSVTGTSDLSENPSNRVTLTGSSVFGEFLAFGVEV